jgi:hypothetical protein
MKTTCLFEDLLRLRGIGADDAVIMLKIRAYLSTLGYKCTSEKPLEYFGITLFGSTSLGNGVIRFEQHWVGVTVVGDKVEMCHEGEYWSFDLYTENWLNKITEILEKNGLKKDNVF